MNKFYLLAVTLALSSKLVTAAPLQDLSAIEHEAEQWLSSALSNSPGAVSYEIRSPDSRLKLAACSRREIGLPAGYRLIGNTMLRVRCVEGASWSFNLPVKIAITVSYVMAARPLAANQDVSPGDIALQQGNLATLPGSVILDPEQAIGRTLNSPIAAGQAIRQEQLRAAMTITQNQRVKVLYRSEGIEISNEGIAMSSAAEGQPVRIRIGNNKIISGTARQGGLVEVGP